jgi:Uma2 family endonuclease
VGEFAMTVTTQRLTFAEYLTHVDETDTRYELVNGELVPMGMGTGQHGAIAKFLERAFDDEIERQPLDWTALKMDVGIRTPRSGRWDTSRIPDVVILPKAQWESLQARESIIELDEPPPLLVVEVVSESTKSTDYRAKRAEYSVREIPEYWIVDPLEAKVTVLRLEEGWYDITEFSGDQPIQSPTLPDLSLTVAQILKGQL